MLFDYATAVRVDGYGVQCFQTADDGLDIHPTWIMFDFSPGEDMVLKLRPDQVPDLLLKFESA